jgi:hypothetical protein
VERKDMTPEKDAMLDIEDFNKVLLTGKQEENVVKPPVKEKEVEQEQEQEAQETEASEEEIETTEEVENEIETEEEAENKALSEEETDKEVEVKETPSKVTHRDTKAEKQIAKLVRERERLKGQLEATRNQARQPVTQETFIDLDAPNPLNYANGENDIDFRVDAKLYQRDKQKKISNFQEIQKEIIKKYEDTTELLEMDAERVASGIKTASPMMAKLVYDSPIPGELWHYLLANSDEAIKITQMDPIKTAVTIGRIEAKLENEIKESKESKEISKEVNTKIKKVLPTPPNPVKSNKANTTVQVKNYGFTAY